MKQNLRDEHHFNKIIHSKTQRRDDKLRIITFAEFILDFYNKKWPCEEAILKAF